MAGDPFPDDNPLLCRRLAMANLWLPAIASGECIVMLSIFHDTLDWPGRWAMRPFLIADGYPEPRAGLCACLYDCYEEAIADIPITAHCFPAAKVGESPGLVETWML